MNKNTMLNWFGLAISLTTLHYGLGFLIGSGESIYTSGTRGILYALSTALGIFSLLPIAGYYIKNKQPIWTLMGKKYGAFVAEVIAFLSSIWMIGVIASQVLGGASVLRTFGFNNQLSIVLMTVAITLLSLINLRTLVVFFTAMLIFSSLSLIWILSFFGFEWIQASLLKIMSDMTSIRFADFTGILLPTVLVTFIGMDFHQFIVKARTKYDAYLGIFASGVFLILISSVLLSLVTAAISQQLLFGLHDPKQAISIILSNFGDGLSPTVSYMLALPIMLVALGSGSGVNRIVNESVVSTKFLPEFFIKKPNVFFAVFLTILLISFSGDSIISLIVAFYAIYVGSIFVPFIAFLLDSRYSLRLKKSSIRMAITYSVICMLAIFIYSYLPNTVIGTNKTSLMILSGFCISVLVLLVSNRTRLYVLIQSALTKHVKKVGRRPKASKAYTMVHHAPSKRYGS